MIEDEGIRTILAGHEQYLAELLRMAPAEQLDDIINWFLDHSELLDWDGSLDLPLEEACHIGNTNIARLLLQEPLDSKYMVLEGAAFWAARNRHYDVLTLLLSKFGTSNGSLLFYALCGASVHGIDSMRQALQAFPVSVNIELSNLDESIRFSDILDRIFATKLGMQITDSSELGGSQIPAPDTDLQHSTDPLADLFPDMIPENEADLERACRANDWPQLVRLANQVRRCDFVEGSFAVSLVAAIQNDGPSILLYWCEKFPVCAVTSHKAAAWLKSTAIYQIMLDTGFNITQAPHKDIPLPLGYAYAHVFWKADRY
jgi:hypothetical protein